MKKNEQSKLISSYAEALFEAAEVDGSTEEIFRKTKELAKNLSNEPQMVQYLNSPFWSNQDKKEILEQVAEKMALSKSLKGLLKTVAENGRSNILIKILQAFSNVYFQKKHITQVDVKSAVALTNEQKMHLTAAMEKYTGNKVVINYQILPDLLGGLLVECGSELIDDTITGKLKRLEMMMKGTE